MRARAVSPVIGVVLVTALAVITAAAVATAVPTALDDPTPVVAFDIDADASGEIRIEHRGGDALEGDSIRVRVEVDGEPLDRQPPVPFFSAPGFESGPTGVFNSATSGVWRAGETASFTVAETNDPTLSTGSTVRVRLYSDDGSVAVLTTTVGGES